MGGAGPHAGRDGRHNLHQLPRRWLWFAMGAAAVAAVGGHTLVASEVLPGPIPADVIEVIDGDTLRVRARIWLGQEVEINVRLSDVDTPELRGDCEGERTMAVRARSLVAAAIDDRPVSLSAIRYGKFAGRILARVHTASGADLSETLVAAGLGRAYAGRKRQPWCDPQT